MSKKVAETPSKKKSAPKVPETPPVIEAQVETLEGEKEVNASQITVKNVVGTTASALDASHRVELLQLADDIFRKDPNAEKRFTVEIREGMNTIIAVGVMSAIIDEAQFGNGSFTAVLQSTVYPQLMVVANDMGIKLPNIKALPNGTVELSSKEIKVSKETKAQLEKEHEIETAGTKGEIELDPAKVAELDDEALVKALEFILITSPKQKKSIKDTLIDCVTFMKAYRVAKAKDDSEKIESYDVLTTYDWLNDAFSFVKPTHLLKGIGIGMKYLVDYELGGVSAFITLRNALIDKETGVPCWDDQSIADATKAIVKWSCEDKIATDKAGIEALDTKADDYAAKKRGYEQSIASNEVTLDAIMNANFDTIDNLIDLVFSGNETVRKMYKRIRKTFFSETANKEASDYKNLSVNIQQKAGVIQNLFREAGNKNQNYSDANITDLVEYTDEEKAEMRKDTAAYAQTLRHAFEKEEESKNA